MLTETVLRWVTEYGYIGVFLLLALGIIRAPIPDEGVLAFAGYLVYEGKMQLFRYWLRHFSAARAVSHYAMGWDAP